MAWDIPDVVGGATGGGGTAFPKCKYTFTDGRDPEADTTPLPPRNTDVSEDTVLLLRW